MFLKKTTIQKNGTRYTYYRIVESYVDENGKRKHRHVQYVGLLTPEEAEQLRAQLRQQSLAERRSRRKAIALEHEPAAKPLPADPQPTRQIYAWKEAQLLCYPAHADKEWNRTDADMLLLVREGRGTLQLEGRKLSLHPGVAVFCPADSGMYVINEHDVSLVIERIAFEKLALSAEEGGYRRIPIRDMPAGVLDYSFPQRVLQWAQELRIAIAQNENEWKIQSLFLQVLSVFFQPKTNEDTQETRRLMEQTIRYIQQHYREPITREQLAARIGVSPEHFSRVFRKETGMSFVEYLGRVRIRKGQELLQFSAKDLHVIAQETGFANDYYFSRKFKQIVGVPPTVYRKQPKRIAVLMPHVTACLLAWGIVPVFGVIGLWMEPWLTAHYRERLDLSGFKQGEWYSDKTVQWLSTNPPDFIIVYREEYTESLWEIAPVLAIPEECSDWREELLMLATAVGRRQQAEQWLKQFQEKALALQTRRDDLRGRGDTFLIVKIVSGKCYVYGNLTSMGGCLIYDVLGLQPPVAVQQNIIEKGLLNIHVPLEDLPAYAADHIFLFHYPSHWPADECEVLESDVWRSLPAVRNGRVYEPDPNIFYGYDPLAMDKQLDWLTELLSHFE
ncbi:helix-turn-helix domain-containing protein [Brevibacillus sp. SAFN-007a]|uniref:AraC family transcriptional regulator n=1 Tax=Brevibacillus sp. SAFN-007a TaxID=3436862 RepID=UPI003F7EEAA6